MSDPRLIRAMIAAGIVAASAALFITFFMAWEWQVLRKRQARWLILAFIALVCIVAVVIAMVPIDFVEMEWYYLQREIQVYVHLK
ncbi:MAG TPA: hypothetical protein VF974_02315 [Patescibacteria group bacterium]